MPDGFLRSWVATHVKPRPRADHSKEAMELSAKCLADAMMLGIPLEALEKVTGTSDMIGYMRRQLEARSPPNGA